MTRFLLICLGGAVGTGARYLVAVWLARGAGAFPYATLAVNVTGSFLLALLMGLSVSTDARLILGIGILGGFTTYSAFNYETLALLRDGAWGVALANVAVTLFGCLAAGAFGLVAARAIAH